MCPNEPVEVDEPLMFPLVIISPLALIEPPTVNFSVGSLLPIPTKPAVAPLPPLIAT